MDLESILDRFEFRPEPERTLTESVEDLRGAVRVLHDAVAIEPSATTAPEVESALRTSRDRIETCAGIIAAHGFERPVVEGAVAISAEGIDWEDLDRVVGTTGDDVGETVRDVLQKLPSGDRESVDERMAADGLDLLGSVPGRLPEPAGERPQETGALEGALLLVVAICYLLSGFGPHPGDVSADAERVHAGFRLLTAVIVGLESRAG